MRAVFQKRFLGFARRSVKKRYMTMASTNSEGHCHISLLCMDYFFAVAVERLVDLRLREAYFFVERLAGEYF